MSLENKASLWINSLLNWIWIRNSMVWILCIFAVYESVKLIRILVSYLELKNTLQRSINQTALEKSSDEEYHISLEEVKTKESYQLMTKLESRYQSDDISIIKDKDRIESKIEVSSISAGANITIAVENYKYNNYFSEEWYKRQRVIEVEKHLEQKSDPTSLIDKLHNTLVDQVYKIYGRLTSINVICFRILEYNESKESTSFLDSSATIYCREK